MMLYKKLETGLAEYPRLLLLATLLEKKLAEDNQKQAQEAKFILDDLSRLVDRLEECSK